MKVKEARKILNVLIEFTKVFTEHFQFKLELKRDGSLEDKVKRLLNTAMENIYKYIYLTQDIDSIEYNGMTVGFDDDYKIQSFSINHKDPIIQFPDEPTDLSILDYLSPLSQTVLKEKIYQFKGSIKSDFYDLKFPLDLRYSDFQVMPVTGLLSQMNSPEIPYSLVLIRHQLPKNEYLKAKRRILPANYNIKARRLAQKLIYNERIVKKLSKFLGNNLNRPLPPWKEIEKEVGYSRSKLTRDFKKKYKTSIYEYHRQLRLERAVLLITTTTKPFKDISEELGFSQSGFTKFIKLLSGKTPSQIRKLGTNDKKLTPKGNF